MILINNIIVQLIEKIRDCPFLKKYDYLLNRTPSIQTEYIEGKGIEIKGISFVDWDRININNKSITFIPEPTRPVYPTPVETLLEYQDWSELCGILGIPTESK